MSDKEIKSFMIAEGRFETMAKTAKKTDELLKEFKKYGLAYNGGDTVYSNSEKNATLISFAILPNGKILDMLKKYGIDTKAMKGEKFLEYNFRSNKFSVFSITFKEGIVPNIETRKNVSAEFNNDNEVKRIIEIFKAYKKAQSDYNSNASDYNKETKGVVKYSREHNLAEESGYFDY